MINKKDLCIRDPYIYEEQGTYYLYGTIVVNNKMNKFCCYKSKDLNEFEGPIILFEPDEKFWADRDYWAPELHKYNNKYYLFGSLKSNNRCRGTQIFVSDKPDGNFVPLTKYPITPNDWECLDGTLYVENETPYIIFCREWLEINDGEIYIMELAKDLTKPANEPLKLFSASEAKWPVSIKDEGNFVTDGPFIIKKKDKLQMIWSSFSSNGYAIALCESKSIFGPWVHKEKPIFEKDGGHAMVFDFKGSPMMAYHYPNGPENQERLQFVPYDY